MVAKNRLKNRPSARYRLNEKRCELMFSAMRLIPDINQTDAMFSMSEKWTVGGRKGQ
jgi:hypothetical protein